MTTGSPSPPSGSNAAWAHLPNAKHIDWVLSSLKQHPEKWDAAWDVARGAAWDVARSTAWGAARGAAWDAVRGAVWDAARDAARGAAWNAARSAAWTAFAAFIAYDDAGLFVDHSLEELKTLHRMDPHPIFLLLQPLAVVKGSHV